MTSDDFSAGHKLKDTIARLRSSKHGYTHGDNLHDNDGAVNPESRPLTILDRQVARDHYSNYTRYVNQVVFAPAALPKYKRLPAAARSLLKKEIREQLALQDPTEETRNRFRLRRISSHADFELGVEPWRLFYRVQGQLVIVELIGRKKGDTLLIDDKEFEL
ncbi:MAG: hypothetical protein ACREP5_13345 [Candidatus Binatia bacterium]